MERSKLWKLAQKLPVEDHRGIDRWLTSPFVNRRKQLSRLWRYVKKCVLIEHGHPTAVAAFAAAFPGEAYDNQKLRLAMSGLYQLLLEFLYFQTTQRHEADKCLQQAKVLRKLGLPKLAMQQLEKARQSHERSTLRHAQQFDLHYAILEESYRLSSSHRPDQADYRSELVAVGDVALIGAKLKQACTLLSHQVVYPTGQQLGFIEAAINYVETVGLHVHPCISLYHQCYMMLLNPTEDQHFREYKQLLLEQGAYFPEHEARDLFLMAINYCIRRVNNGERPFVAEAMELYKAGLQRDSLLENNVISRFTYHNIVIMGLQTQDYGWVEQFIHTYRSKLEPAYQEGAFHYCLARLEYARLAFDAALLLLQKANYKDPLLNLAAKVLQLKIFFEAKAFDVLYAHLEAMEIYIRRKRVIGYHKANYLNLIKFTKRLCATNEFDKAALQKLANAIRAAEPLTEKQWLLQQLKL